MTKPVSDGQRTEEGRTEALARLSAGLRAGEAVTDAAFDALLPKRWRWVSDTHWTPLEVCRAAAPLLAPGPEAIVLDVGSGVGKLCLSGALSSGASFVNVEQRPHLVKVASALAEELGALSAKFVCADAFSLDWHDFTSLYFFNPFAEAIFPQALRIDATVKQTEEEHAALIDRLEGRLTDLRPGARVVVYCGLGCRVPEAFERRESQRLGHNNLELWVRS
jgi:SAM-dependent methyltransferase